MNLFLNAVSSAGILILFNEDRQVIDSSNIDILWNESSKLSWLVDVFLKKNDITYSQIENIVVVNWPWSFTWVRVISLIVNTISFVNKSLRLTAIDFFSMFNKYPIIKWSSKRDLFVKISKYDKIKIVKNDDFIEYLKKENINKVFGDNKNNLTQWEFEINSNINYKPLLETLNFDDKDIINPLYIKKPNIT